MSRRVYIDIEDPRCVCPLCGAGFKWSCKAENGSAGHAACQQGMEVSRHPRRNPEPSGGPCLWRGTRVYRGRDGRCYVRWPFSTHRFTREDYPVDWPLLFGGAS